MSGADAECLALVRLHDRDSYIASLFAPDEMRPHLLALHAFSVEISRIRDVVSDANIGMIRLQWWRDTLDALFEGGTGGGHPVAEALSRAIAAAALPKAALADLVTAHEFDLFADRMPDITALEAYLGETRSRLIQMAAMILDRDAATAASEAAGLAGVAHGLALILGDPRRRGPFLPEGMDVSGALAQARKRLAEAEALLPGLPKSVLPAFLPLSLTGLYLEKIAAAPDAPRPLSALRRQWRIWRTAKRWG